MSHKINKKIIYSYLSIVIAIITIISSFSSFIDEYNSKVTDDNISYSEEISNENIEDLIESIKVEDPKDVIYLRDDWESPVKKFESNIDGEKISIRKYAIEISVWTYSIEENNFSFCDPYTGKYIEDESEIEYDHIIPLHYAAEHGGNDWSDDKKNNYAFDLEVGVPCSKSENRIKSDKGPSEYLPDKNKEEYCYSWLIIAKKYDISIAKEDMEVIRETLKNTKECKVINEVI